MNNNNENIWMLIAFVAICFFAGPLIIGAVIVVLTVVVPILIVGAILWALAIGVGNWMQANGHIDINKN